MADFTGITFANANASDLEAAKFIVDHENERRAAADPVETPLPTANNAEYAASYESMLLVIIANAHESYKTQAARQAEAEADLRTRWEISSAAQRTAALAQLEATP